MGKNDLIFEYNQILKEYDNNYKNLSRNFNMSESAFWTLYTIRSAGRDLTQSEICDMQYVSKQTVNSSLKNLENKGLITLERTDDKRKKHILLTEEGLKVASETVDKLLDAESSAFAQFDSDEIRTFFNVAKEYNKILENKIKEMFDREE